MLSLLLWVSPANLWGDEVAGFSPDAARQLIGKYKGLVDETAYQKKEISLLKDKSLQLSLANGELLDLNLTYSEMVDDLHIEVDLLEGDMVLCEGRAEDWKSEATSCGKDLADCRSVPWYKSKSFWLPLTFIAGVYTGAQAR